MPLSNAGCLHSKSPPASYPTGPKLFVIEYRLSNPARETRTYKERLFVRTGTGAVAIEQHRLKPGEPTRLFLAEEVVL